MRRLLCRRQTTSAIVKTTGEAKDRGQRINLVAGKARLPVKVNRQVDSFEPIQILQKLISQRIFSTNL
jgi:hypothetical protein